MRRAITAALILVLPALLSGLGTFGEPVRSGPFTPAGGEHPLGTDQLGDDVLHQLLDGAARSIYLPTLATAALMVLGVLGGIGIGLLGRQLREPVLRAVDLVLVLPPMVVLLVVVAGLDSQAWSLALAVVGIGWASVARLFAQATTQITESGHVQLARTIGTPRCRVLTGEMWPRLRRLVAAESGLRLIAATQLIAAAAFLGFGGEHTWGAMARDGLRGMSLNPWATLAPSIALVVMLILVASLLDEQVAAGAVDRHG